MTAPALSPLLPFSIRPPSPTFRPSSSPNRLSISANRLSGFRSCDVIPRVELAIEHFVQSIGRN